MVRAVRAVRAVTRSSARTIVRPLGTPSRHLAELPPQLTITSYKCPPNRVLRHAAVKEGFQTALGLCRTEFLRFVQRQGVSEGSIMAKPALILVGADKGGVGKTTIARTLLYYFTAHHVPTRAFDSESPKGTLKRFHPDVADIVDAPWSATSC